MRERANAAPEAVALQRESSPQQLLQGTGTGTPDLPQVQLLREVLGKPSGAQGLQTVGAAPGGTANRFIDVRPVRNAGAAGGTSVAGSPAERGPITSAAAALGGVSSGTTSPSPGITGNGGGAASSTAGVIRSSRGHRRPDQSGGGAATGATSGDQRPVTPGSAGGVGRPLTTRPASSMKNRWTIAPGASADQEASDAATAPMAPGTGAHGPSAAVSEVGMSAVESSAEAVSAEGGSATAVRAGSSPATCQSSGPANRLRIKSRSGTRPHSAQPGTLAAFPPSSQVESEEQKAAEGAAATEASAPAVRSSAGSRATPNTSTVGSGGGITGGNPPTLSLPAGAGAVAARAAPRSNQATQRNILQGFEAPTGSRRAQPGSDGGANGIGDTGGMDAQHGSEDLPTAGSPRDGVREKDEPSTEKPTAPTGVSEKQLLGEHTVPSDSPPPLTEPPTPSSVLPAPSPPSSTPPSAQEQAQPAQPSKKIAKRSRSMEPGRRSGKETANGEQEMIAVKSAGQEVVKQARSGTRVKEEPEVSLLPSGDAPDCQLLGAEDLPVIGAAGVLVLPKRPGINGAANPSLTEEDSWLFGEELSGWGADCEREDLAAPERLMDLAQRDRLLAEYVASDPSGSGPDSSEAIPSLQDLLAATDGTAPSPLQGPSLLQLSQDPKRREECPVCAAEWRRVIKELGTAKEAAEAAPAPIRRRAATGKGKMHSVRCAWAWFQQNLSVSLRSLRFDAQGVARQYPQPASRVLPPPIMDIWNYWRQKGGRSEKTDRANTSDRLMRGDSAV